MHPPPANLTIISCKYENRQRLQFTTEFAKRPTTTLTNKHCAILPSLCRHCQSKAQQNMGAGYAFLPIKQVDLLPSELESGVRVTCDVGYIFANFSLPRLLCSRLGTRQTDVRQTDVRRASSLNASDLWGRGHNNNQSATLNSYHYSSYCTVLHLTVVHQYF